MKNYEFTGKLISYERLNNSPYGNPRYYGVFENENGEILKATTATDATCAYAFLNDIKEDRKLTYHVTGNGNAVIDRISIAKKEPGIAPEAQRPQKKAPRL